MIGRAPYAIPDAEQRFPTYIKRRDSFLVVDSAVGDSIVATSKGALAVAKFEFTAEEASFGKSVVIPKGNEDLVAVVNEVIAQVLADGSYQAAYDEAVALAAQMGV